MSAFKKLKTADSFVSIYNATKNFQVDGSSLSTYGIEKKLARNKGTDTKLYPSESNYEKYLNYNSIKHLYYNNFIEYDNVLISGSYDHYLESSLFSGSRNLTTSTSSESFILSFPKEIVGSYIEPGSFDLTGYYGSGGSTERYFQDNGEGYLVYTGTNISSTGSFPIGSIVGDINYRHGTVIITETSLTTLFNIAGNYTASWNSTYPVVTLNYHCKANSSEFLFSSNPSACEIEDALVGSLSYSGGLIKSNLTGSEFTPYITTVGLYNDSSELVAVAKLGQPVPKSKINDMTFVVKLDI